jgi:hypothetical protein
LSNLYTYDNKVAGLGYCRWAEIVGQNSGDG